MNAERIKCSGHTPPLGERNFCHDCGSAALWNARRLHMEPCCRICEHPCCRPLLRPQANPRENPFVASHKFGKQSAVTLRMNFSSKNLHTWDPGFLNVALVSVRADKFARLQASLRKPFSE